MEEKTKKNSKIKLNAFGILNLIPTIFNKKAKNNILNSS